MDLKKNTVLDAARLARVLESIPVGITIIDRDGHILYYNAYCAKLVDRKPEYIGRDIRFCHQKPESIEKIDKILAELNAGTRTSVYYESERNGKRFGVTVSPFEVDGELIGFIQSAVIIR